MNNAAVQRNKKKPERKMKDCESSVCGETQFKIIESVEKNKKIKLSLVVAELCQRAHIHR